jgi:hypothetical protein
MKRVVRLLLAAFSIIAAYAWHHVLCMPTQNVQLLPFFLELQNCCGSQQNLHDVQMQTMDPLI